APQLVAQRHPIEFRVGFEILLMLVENYLAVSFTSTAQRWFSHFKATPHPIGIELVEKKFRTVSGKCPSTARIAVAAAAASRRSIAATTSRCAAISASTVRGSMRCSPKYQNRH